MSTRRRLLPAAGVALCAAALGGCSWGSPASGGGAAAGPTATIAAREIAVHLSDGADRAEVARLRARIAAMSSDGVGAVRYRSAAEGLADLRARLKDPSILDELPANPVPAALIVRLAPGADREAVVAAIGEAPPIDPHLGVR